MSDEVVLRIRPTSGMVKVETNDNGVVSHKEITGEALTSFTWLVPSFMAVFLDVFASATAVFMAVVASVICCVVELLLPITSLRLFLAAITVGSLLTGEVFAGSLALFASSVA